MDIDIKLIKSLMRALRRYDMAEIELRSGDEEIVIRRTGTTTTVHPASVGAVAFPMATAERGAANNLSGRPENTPSPEPSPDEDPSLFTVRSPLVGTFYTAPGPGAPPFVQAGTVVRTGTVLCIVEAMKLMNEIESEVAGTVVEVLVENGRPVEFGEKLFRIRRGAGQ